MVVTTPNCCRADVLILLAGLLGARRETLQDSFGGQGNPHHKANETRYCCATFA